MKDVCRFDGLTVSRLVCLSACVLVGELDAQTVHRVVPDTHYNTLWRGHPIVARIKPGDIVNTKTPDSHGRDERGVQIAQPVNPMVGPIHIEGAEPGDAISVTSR